MRHAATQLATNWRTSFASVETNQEAIWRKLFVESQPHSNLLKRLLVINTPDCLDTSQHQYDSLIRQASIGFLRDKNYIRTTPKLQLGDFEEVKSYILLEFDTVTPTTNPEFRAWTISFTITCHLDHWDLEDYKIRPYQIAGIIDGLINNTKMAGIGTLQFMGGASFKISDDLGGLILRYTSVTNNHGDDGEHIINPALPTPSDNTWDK